MVSRAVVDCALYEDGRRLPGPVELSDVLERIGEKDGRFVWIGLFEPTAEQFAEIAAAFGLHPLAEEDAVRAHQRPKLERYGDTLFLVLKTITYVEHEKVTATSEIVDTGEIMVFAGPGFAIVVRHGSAKGLTGVRRDLEATPELLALGPAAVLHAVADHVVDGYLEAADSFERDVEELEAAVFSAERTDDSARIYQLKRELLEFKRAVAPLTLPLQRLSDGSLPQIPAAIAAYLRDAADHHTQAKERILAFDELVSSILDAGMARLSMQQNTDMRRISAWAALAAVPTMVAGVYGMNFDYMPELHWTFGYPAVLLFTVTVCVFIFRAFRRNDWL
ncbi:magnesium/cobalt transporter CorA [Kitasatospora sp. Ki12]|uniref:magnesium and cobalt transport protein CorA n=1 Tax=Kitasatospora xanthocidica TaxID=83382 RepID=UPI00167A3AD0|nr:magnesium and cobalt transport protein CorA [Kitasatospora xanthocidica]GHF38053.1 magnesium transport protein CorA [Kitasatospora xanthocidica]